jgi:hypothetical protein
MLAVAEPVLTQVMLYRALAVAVVAETVQILLAFEDSLDLITQAEALAVLVMQEVQLVVQALLLYDTLQALHLLD